ncbi:DUF3137 domain-containing protein, partial [Maribacter sp.]|uniref:DUF3137 domain-containing protein n=1 Tax=Maribacter sp. TaxID=1897614 RepID=UPI0025C1B117
MDNQLIQNVYSEVKEELNSIYSKRKRTLFFQKIMWGSTGIYFLLMLVNMALSYFTNVQLGFLDAFQATVQNPYANVYPIIFLVILLYPAVFFFTNAFKKLMKKEQTTISKMVKMLFPKVDFGQGMAAPLKEIKNSKIFSWVDNSTMVANYGQLRSSIDNRVVNIADIGIIEENTSNKLAKGLMLIPILNILVIFWNYVLKNIFTNKTADNVQYTFRGMFGWLAYPKKLHGHTVVLTNNQKLKIDRFASFNFKKEQKVLLEDVRFTNKFVVYSTDQVEARYVLSTALMERVLALEEKFNRPILLSFHNEKMYLAVENTHGLFSFPSGKLDDIAIVE